MISLITCIDRNRLIGSDGKLPWHLPADMALFKEKTMGHAVVMGRKTYESIDKPLSGRHNIVLTRDKSYRVEYPTNEVRVLHSMGSFNSFYKFLPETEEVFVIGGAHIYEMFIDIADCLYVTEINDYFQGNTYFPPIDRSKWKMIAIHKGIRDAKNDYDYRFLTYERK